MEINKDKNEATADAGLRRRAEEQMKIQATDVDYSRTADEMQHLVHELEVHQIELEMQNTELRQARDEEEKALKRYTDLYDFAPVGYFTLDRSGIISSVNLSGASHVGIERTRLVGLRFELFVQVNARPFFSEFLDKVFASQHKEFCEVTLTKGSNHQYFVQIEAVAAASGQECRLALIDVSRHRQAEEALTESEKRMYRQAKIADNAIVMLDDNGTVTFCNVAAERIFCRPATEITGRDFHRLFLPKLILETEEQGFARFRERRTRAR